MKHFTIVSMLKKYSEDMTAHGQAEPSRGSSRTGSSYLKYLFG